MSSQQSYKIAPTLTQHSIDSKKTNQDQIQEAEVLMLPNLYPSQDSIEQSNNKSTKEDQELQKINELDKNNKQANKANKKQESIDSYANQDMQERKQKMESQETMKNQKRQTNQTTIAPWKALLQYQIKSKSTGIGIKGSEENNKKSANLNSDQQRKVLRKIRQKNKKSKSNSKSQVSFMQTRKLVEPALQIINLDLEQPDNATRPISSRVQLVSNPRQVGNSALLSQPKNNFRRKNFKFEQKLTKIRDLKLQSSTNKHNEISSLPQANTNINIKGQIIFTWDRQNINEKWAKTEMTCIQIWDGTGSIIVTVPYKMVVQRGFRLEVGNYVVVKAGQIRQKYPRNICILITEKSSIELIPRNQVHQSQLCQPQSLCMSLAQLINQPATRICNVQCLVIKKYEKEYIRSSKQNELCLCKLQVYDPIENIKVIVKLWQDKANINFYYNSVVYLLRGIEVRDFKGVKEYHAVKDFNFRGLGYSRIGEYLKPMLKQRRKFLKQMPSNIARMNIRDSIIAYQHSRRKSTAQDNEETSLKVQKRESQQNLTLLNKQISSSENYHFSVSLVRFLSLQLSPLFPIKSAYCKVCGSPTMLNCTNRSFCSQCKSKEFRTQYAVKCEFQDGYQRYSGQILQQAGRKMFAVGKQAVQVEFLGTMNAGFREMISKDAVGDAVRAIVAYGTENAGEEKIQAFFIVDLLPFEDDQTQESVNEDLCIASIASSEQPNF